VAGTARHGTTGWSPLASLLAAAAVGLLAALAWSILRGILDLGVGLLAVSAFGGWGIAVALRQGLPSRPVAAAIGLGAWVASLLATWLVTRVTLPASTLELADRLAQQPFLEYIGPQLGLIELISLLLFAGTAWVAARRPSA
jgi:hypothetical protein